MRDVWVGRWCDEGERGKDAEYRDNGRRKEVEEHEEKREEELGECE